MLKLLLSNVRFSVLFRHLEESTHWQEDGKWIVSSIIRCLYWCCRKTSNGVAFRLIAAKRKMKIVILLIYLLRYYLVHMKFERRSFSKTATIFYFLIISMYQIFEEILDFLWMCLFIFQKMIGSNKLVYINNNISIQNICKRCQIFKWRMLVSLSNYLEVVINANSQSSCQLMISVLNKFENSNIPKMRNEFGFFFVPSAIIP